MSEENEAVAYLYTWPSGSKSIYWEQRRTRKAGDVTVEALYRESFVTALQSQVRTLTERVAELEEQLDLQVRRQALADLKEKYELQAADLASARADVEMLREALDDYGYHKVSCDLYQNSLGRNCTCGLSAALAPQTKESPK